MTDPLPYFFVLTDDFGQDICAFEGRVQFWYPLPGWRYFHFLN